MKSFSPKASLLVLLSALFFTSCTKDQNESYESTTREFISQGRWSVDYFYAGSDRTAQFSSYHFNFYGNGTLSGNTGTGDFTGSWTVMKDVNYNDVLRITIGAQDPNLSDLNEHWNVTSKSSSVISMKDSNSELRFRKL